MKRLFIGILLLLQFSLLKAQTTSIADSATYLADIKKRADHAMAQKPHHQSGLSWAFGASRFLARP
jgi:hypothetical protein